MKKQSDRTRRVRRDNVSVHRSAANKLNIKKRATRGSVCNALLCRDLLTVFLLAKPSIASP